MMERRWRLWAGAIALCGWSGLIMEVFLVFARYHALAPTLWRLALFFTMLSNLTVAIVFTGIAFGAPRLRHPLLIGGLAMTMALVGSVFELMLRRILHPTGWRLVSSALLHDAVPLLTVGAWFFLAEKGRLRARDPWLIAIFPIVYLGYALVRGATGGDYPYPFIDPRKIGWAGVSAYVIGISAAFLVCGHLMVLLDRRLGRR
ncbi:Pr6Pr family membrane protein [Sphingomonas sp. BIUV-7]|uniref:Pr6Pr family membrane protein n=1 Tax=Sphingomonas natans TaxID=3063330 RepID=A0ABT8Y9Z4_9SPHN|nr:Pr6Pr family membrane protein [Sphingomonas sp. BIUV-7]MDO6415151.1 Pr6Pr family membrane protein [Sphingomonas sp. BIUV-7]